ncbi:hypothetical protein [Embleya scabrispora]|uniref:hypothetical protein n=1 Tax=Embleya scabrispora TaxID=159449 RepID=UPI0019653E4D|nr:hypothetical protein [Embleya scabrispora]
MLREFGEPPGEVEVVAVEVEEGALALAVVQRADERGFHRVHQRHQRGGLRERSVEGVALAFQRERPLDLVGQVRA